MRTVLQLVRDECANHDNCSNGINNYCYCETKEDNLQCGYFYKENYECSYFEECVLPLDKQSEALYYANKEAKNNNRELSGKERKEIKNETGKRCGECKKYFIPVNNRQKYCDNCKKKVQKRQSKIRNRGKKKSESKLTL